FVAMNAAISGADTIHDIVITGNLDLSGNNLFHNATVLGDGIIAGTNEFNDLTFNTGHTYTISPTNTTVIIDNKWSIQGSCTSYIILKSATQGSFATVQKASGSVLGFNLHIKDIHCVGGATFNAYNSVDQGGNAGWNFQLLPPLLPPLAIVGPTTVCPGATGVVYHTSPVQGAISYSWTVPGGATITSGQGDTLIVVNFGTSTGGNITVATFDGCQYSTSGSVLTVTMASPITPTVSLTASPAGPICSGTLVNFLATATNNGTGTFSYNFKVNGVSLQNGASNAYATNALANTDIVTCEITISGSTCYLSYTAISNAITMNVAPSMTPVVSILANPSGPVCTGTSVVFTSTASTNGTGTLVYNFKVNGTSVQNGASSTYSSSTLLNGDVVTCIITISGGTCYSSTAATSNAITMTIVAPVTPAVSIAASPVGPVCGGTSVSFVATAVTNGTGTVTYTFKVNGTTVQSGASNSYSTTTLANGDVVNCSILITGGACLATNSVSSNSITANILSNQNASLSIAASANNICPFTSVTFTANATNGGAGARYQWKVNGNNAGTNSSTFVTTTLNNGDIVTCVLTSNYPCISNATVNSNEIKINVIDCVCEPNVPNAFSPNGDGIHDRWVITYAGCLARVDVFVYNRYGSLVYQAENYHNDWEGTYRSKTLPDATYYYVIKAYGITGREQLFKGNVTILR
ncbi:MAG TPA: gliding motility-associated C-terminal domain-containing protein, partial [Ferruginibacter sp.]|nr:gliding motility-associated C-terminal domain-containing protein [Ferruginibacter sp.]